MTTKSFRITGPGFYKNRRGEKVEIQLAPYPFTSDDTGDGDACYEVDGSHSRIKDGVSYPDLYIVGVWDEWEEIKQARKEQPMKSPEVQSPKTSSYNLELPYERVRALFEGRTIKLGVDSFYGPKDLVLNCEDIVGIEGEWSLVPETKRVVTKLWVYQNGLHWFEVGRSEAPYSPYPMIGRITCLGAIEGSEREEDVPV